MSALYDLMPASFRGVPFLCPKGSVDSGRHAIKHEYPDSNTRYVEDNGLDVPDYKLTCVIHGPDALSKVRRFQAALKTPGPGTLRHPIDGRQFVQVGRYTYKHDDKDVGVYEFDVTFHVTGPPLFPGLLTGVAAAVTGLVASAIGALFTAFTRGIDAISVGAMSARSLLVVGGALASAASAISGAFGQVADVRRLAATVARQPEALLLETGRLEPVMAALFRAPLEDRAVSQRELWHGFEAVRQQAIEIRASAAGPADTVDVATRHAALEALGAAIETAAFLSMCEAAAGKEYATADEVGHDLAVLTEARASIAEITLDPAVRELAIAAFVETTEVLEAQQVALPYVKAIEIVDMPASVLTYMLYDSDENLPAIVGLNPTLSPLLYDGQVDVMIR